MKKTLSINIAGFIFHIEEDAYEVLDAYIQSIHQYFANFEGSKEIIADIESRIAEKFYEIREREQKEVIEMPHVEALIASLGTVADFQDFENSQSEEAPKAQPSSEAQSKPFRRDLTRRKLGGVAAGLATYFDVDPLWVRLLMVFGFLGLIPIMHVSNAVFWIYIICWIAIPGIEHQEEDNKKYRKFFRDPENKVVGGVMSGLAAYTGWDLGLLRVLALVSVFAFGTGVLAYFILMIIAPEAKTLTDKMAMTGEPITLENIENNIKKVVEPSSNPSTWTKILMIPFKIVAAVFEYSKGFLTIVRWFVQYLAAFILLVFSISILASLIGVISVGISGLDHGLFSINFGEAIPIFLLVNDVPQWVFWAFAFAILPLIVSIGIAGVSLFANKRYYNKAYSIVATTMSIIGWIGVFYGMTIVGGNFSRTASYNKIQNHAASDSLLNFDINRVSQESIFENMLGEYISKEDILDEEDLHDFNRNNFNRARIELQGYQGDSVQVVQFYKSNGANRPEAEFNAKQMQYAYQVSQGNYRFDTHFGVKNKKYRNQRLRIKVLIPYGKNFSMSREFAYFMVNLLDSGYFNEELGDLFKGSRWVFTTQGKLECLNRQPASAGEDWEHFDDEFDKKLNREQ